jgi:signal transduction histidine kinase
MTVEDDGIGLPSAEPGTGAQSLGILGMKERAEALGGNVDVALRVPCGTKVVLRLPLRGGVS